MAFINYRTQANSQKCEKCKLNFVAKKKVNSELSQLSETFMKFACNLCPIQKDFKKVYGLAPVQHFKKVLN